MTAFTDTHGRQAGEHLLAQIGHRLTAAVEGEDTVARVGDAEFMVLYNALVGPEHEGLRTRLSAALDEALTVDGLSVTVTASISLVVSRRGELGPELLSRADETMREQKEQQPAGATTAWRTGAQQRPLA